jgi:hypothetical protein
MHRQFNIVARTRKRQPRRFNRQKAGQELLYTLNVFGVHANVTYIMPNFIIDVSNPAQQLQILSWSPIQTEAYTFDLLPWSREHEFAQLPWIIGMITTSTIAMFFITFLLRIKLTIPSFRIKMQII